MPIDYVCNQCELVFTIGSYHNHSLPFKETSVFTCGACGVMYALEETTNQVRKFSTSIPNEIAYWKSTDHDSRRKAMDELLKLYLESIQTDNRFLMKEEPTFGIHYGEWLGRNIYYLHPCVIGQWIAADFEVEWILYPRAYASRFIRFLSLGKSTCLYCGNQGNFLTKNYFIESRTRCPSCGTKPLFRIADWMT